jgi:hypothetical protein
MSMYKGSFNEEHGAQQSSVVQATILNSNIKYSQIKVLVRDGCAVNGLTMEHLKGVQAVINGVPRYIPGPMNHAVDNTCLSHTTDNCGSTYILRRVEYPRLGGPNAKEYTNHVTGLFQSDSTSAKVEFQKVMGKVIQKKSGTRWWSEQDVQEDIIYFMRPVIVVGEPQRPSFAEWIKDMYENGVLSGIHMSYLYKTLVQGIDGFNVEKLAWIELELAVVVDVSKSLRIATADLEGDKCLSLITMKILQKVCDSFETCWPDMHYLNVHARMTEFSTAGLCPPDSNDSSMQSWVVYAQGCAIKCKEHFYDKVFAQNNIPLYRACRLCDPEYFFANKSWRGIDKVPPTSLVTDVKALLQPMVTANFIDQNTVDSLCGPELQEYVAICTEKQVNFSTLNTSDHCDALSAFWNDLKIRLPLWYYFTTLCMLLIPSSTSIERVF